MHVHKPLVGRASGVLESLSSQRLRCFTAPAQGQSATALWLAAMQAAARTMQTAARATATCDKIICLGKNYLAHARELGDAVPDKPGRGCSGGCCHLGDHLLDLCDAGGHKPGCRFHMDEGRCHSQ